jgi:hypothetical protein
MAATAIHAQQPTACVTNRNAPPISAYYWPPDTTVKVYFNRNSFTPEQRSGLFEAMMDWTEAGTRTGTGIQFVDAGDSDSLTNCEGCLTVTRSDVHKRDRNHYAFFNPLTRGRDGLLIAAWIDLDLATVSPDALRGFMAHELGHGMGLWDCESCKKKQSIMSGFPGVNQNNGLVSPSDCDLEIVRRVYQIHRQQPVMAFMANGVPGS